MRYIGIIILLVFCLTLLLLTGCMINTAKSEPASGNLENQEDINQSSNNSQSSSTDPVEEPATEEPAEEPVIEEDTEATGTVYPQKWATGDGTAENPWANDCIQIAYDFVPAGGTVFLKSGYYTLSTSIEINKQVNIIGEGMGKTIITTANANGFLINEVDYVSIKNLTIDGDAQTDGTKYLSCIEIDNSDYVSLEDIEVKNAGYYGISCFQDNHSLCQNIHAHDNYRHGLSLSSNIAGRNKYNTYQDIYAWNNGVCGFGDRGISDGTDLPEDSYNTFDNLLCWDNGSHGIVIVSQNSGVLSNSSVWGNGSDGIRIYDVENFNVHDCSITLSDAYGLHIMNSDNINSININIKNNYSGIEIRNCSDVQLTSCQSYDDRETPLQLYGIELDGTNTGISLLNCKLTPNKEGEIYNPAGAGVVLTVIAEKKGCPRFSSFKCGNSVMYFFVIL